MDRPCIFMLVLCSWAHAVLGQPGTFQGAAPGAEVICSGPLGAPSTITPTIIDASSVEICWDPPLVGAECVSGYLVQLGTDSPREEAGPCATFDTLDTGSDYVVSVRSTGENGTESDPTELTFTTAVVIPPSPENPVEPEVVVIPPSPENPVEPEVVVVPPSPENPVEPEVVVVPPSPEADPRVPVVPPIPPSPSPPPSPSVGPSCESATATAISDAKVEGCGSQAFASSSAIAQVICNADGTVEVQVTSEANAEAQAALQKQNEECGSPKPDGGQECIDALTALVTASQSSCTSSTYNLAYTNAQKVCGSSFDTLVQGLKVCQSTPSTPSPSPSPSPSPPSPPPPPPPTCANATTTAIAEAKAAGCQSEAYSKAQTKAEIICNADGTVDVQVTSEANAEADAALKQQALECGYQRPQDIQQTCIDALTNVVTQARINGCDSSGYEGAQNNAKNVCGSRYETLNNDLGVCDFSTAGTEVAVDGSHLNSFVLAGIVAFFHMYLYQA